MVISCQKCKRDFHQWQFLNQHLVASTSHAHCSRCRQGFNSMDALVHHLCTEHSWILPTAGNAAASGERTSQLPTLGEQARVLEPPVSMAISLSISEADHRPYNGIPRSLVTPVFRAACNLRFKNPSPEDIIRKTGSALDGAVISAIIEAALRLLPRDNTAKGIQLRREKALAKLKKAEEAESAFIERLSVLDDQLLRETQQKQRIQADIEAGLKDTIKLTPDVLFSKPTAVCGVVCRWLEYKNTFGFKSSPFVASRNKAQFNRYALQLGTGIVVYKLGYETDLVQIDGVYCFREIDVIQWLDAAQA